MEVAGEGLARFFDVVLPHMKEVQRRVVAGAASELLGRGGKSAVAEASGMSRNTVIKAEREIRAGIEPSEQLLAEGDGDRPLIDKQPGLLDALDEGVGPRPGASFGTVLRLLHQLGYSPRANATVAAKKEILPRSSASPELSVDRARVRWRRSGAGPGEAGTLTEVREYVEGIEQEEPAWVAYGPHHSARVAVDASREDVEQLVAEAIPLHPAMMRYYAETVLAPTATATTTVQVVRR
ncbi:MAG: hypothetical protein ACREQM_21860 [Candidatus Dormibacteraceae bacterium]